MHLKSWPSDAREKVRKYMSFLVLRSKGQIMSGATFIRDFVYNHPAYKQDSVVSKEISCDLI